MQSIRDLKRAMSSEKDHLAHKRMCAVHAVLALKYPQTQVAETLDVTVRTLQNWLGRFDSDGADGLRDLPREGRPPNIPRRAAEKLAADGDLTPKNLAREIRATWGAQYSLCNVRKILHALHYSIKTATAALCRPQAQGASGDGRSGHARLCAA